MGLYIQLAFPTNGLQISLKSRATRKKIKTGDRLQPTGVHRGSGGNEVAVNHLCSSRDLVLVLFQFKLENPDGCCEL